ncbi:hypothetical protein [Streptomyces sp. NPDC012888]|uniref:hypothetical protein n=1 Tax=Streptomyces sp. NPDC012888 TaxID=3364855 RepID=UPI0036D0B5D3
MTTAEHLETIERLRTCAFPEVKGRSGTVTSGPGYHLAELGGSRWYGDEDPADRLAGEEQLSAEYGALTDRLTDRWGKPQVFAPAGLPEWSRAGEEPAEPWTGVCATTDHVHLWRAGDRWLAVYAGHWGADHSPQLMAVVTVVDPP